MFIPVVHIYPKRSAQEIARPGSAAATKHRSSRALRARPLRRQPRLPVGASLHGV